MAVIISGDFGEICELYHIKRSFLMKINYKISQNSDLKHCWLKIFYQKIRVIWALKCGKCHFSEIFSLKNPVFAGFAWEIPRKAEFLRLLCGLRPVNTMVFLLSFLLLFLKFWYRKNFKFHAARLRERTGGFCRFSENAAGRVFACSSHFFTCAASSGKISHDADGAIPVSRFRRH